MLNLHPEISCPSEHQFKILHNGFEALFNNYNNALQTIDRRTGGQGASLVDPDTFAEIFKYTVEVIIKSAARGKPIMGANDNAVINFLELYDSLFESPKMIAIFRNPIDTGISSWHHNLRLAREEGPEHRELAMKYGGFDGWLRQTAHWFNNAVKSFKSYSEMHNNAIYIRYEDLVSNKETHLEQIFTFLGAGIQGNIIDNIIEESSFASMKKKSSQPDFFRSASTSFGAGEVSDKLLAEIAGIAGSSLKYIGYDIISSQLLSDSK
jgi:hypothetical protein